MRLVHSLNCLIEGDEKALSFLCKVVVHKWSKPRCAYHSGSNVRDCEAYCKRCGKRKTWIEV